MLLWGLIGLYGFLCGILKKLPLNNVTSLNSFPEAPIGSIVIPACGLHLGSYKVISTRNYLSLTLPRFGGLGPFGKWSPRLFVGYETRFPSGPLIIRVPFFLLFGFSKGTQKDKGQKGTTGEAMRET